MIPDWEDPNNELLYAELCWERYGPPPVAELRRPLLEHLGAGGPDTPEAVAGRRRVAELALRGGRGRRPA